MAAEATRALPDARLPGCERGLVSPPPRPRGRARRAVDRPAARRAVAGRRLELRSTPERDRFVVRGDTDSASRARALCGSDGLRERARGGEASCRSLLSPQALPTTNNRPA